MTIVDRIFRELWPCVSLDKTQLLQLINSDSAQFISRGRGAQDAVRCAMSIVGVSQYSGKYTKRKIKRIAKILLK